MSIELPIAPCVRESRAVVRIAIPSWRRGRRQEEPILDDTPCREDYQRLLNGALEPSDITILSLTRAERRQLSISRRVRDALYDSATPVCADRA